MRITKQEYQKLYQKYSPPSPSLKTVPRAFLVGGLICTFGQVLLTLFTAFGLE